MVDLLQFDLSRASNDPPVLGLGGELDVASVGRLRVVLACLVARPASTVVVDLSRLEFVDCHGFAPLVEAHDRLAARHAALVLWAPSRAVRRLLTLTGLDRRFAITGRAWVRGLDGPRLAVVGTGPS